MHLLKLTFSDFFVFDKVNLVQMLQLINVKDKQMRILISNIVV